MQVSNDTAAVEPRAENMEDGASSFRAVQTATHTQETEVRTKYECKRILNTCQFIIVLYQNNDHIMEEAQSSQEGEECLDFPKDPKERIVEMRSEEQGMRLRILQQQSELYAFQMQVARDEHQQNEERKKREHEARMKEHDVRMKVLHEEQAYWSMMRSRTGDGASVE